MRFVGKLQRVQVTKKISDGTTIYKTILQETILKNVQDIFYTLQNMMKYCLNLTQLFMNVVLFRLGHI